VCPKIRPSHDKPDVREGPFFRDDPAVPIAVLVNDTIHFKISVSVAAKVLLRPAWPWVGGPDPACPVRPARG
jgi:hypothetical protein